MSHAALNRSRRTCFALVLLAGLGACAQQQVIENTATSVTVRYGGIGESLDDAAAAAQQACAAHGATAHLRATENLGIEERYAHFDCVGASRPPPVSSIAR